VGERDRRTYTVVWVAVTVLASAFLVVKGSALFALVLVVVAGAGLVAFLRATHPDGAAKPALGIFFDDQADRDAADPAEQGPRPPDGGGPGRRPAARDAAPPAPDAAPSRTAPAAAGTGPRGPRSERDAGASAGAEVIDLRQPVRRERPAERVVRDRAVNEGVVTDDGGPGPSGPATGELAEHHVRLLRQVQVKLRDYE
jgi:hypothetical protein